jgi:hypothetical protein
MFVAAIAAALPRTACAQIPSNEQWQTISTPHFRVHFTAPLEAQARHAAAIAELAYSNLAGELVAPRGPVDLVISDGTDASNGSATVIPRPLVIMFARPPIDDPSLVSYQDWTVLVLQHELTHIFQLDRSEGWWRTAQSVFGRNPVLFPNYYTPSWLTEGLAVYYESRFTAGGRLHSSYEAAVLQSAAMDDAIPSLGELSLATSRFPNGQSVYVYGSLLWEDIASQHGDAAVPKYVDRASGVPIPYFLDRGAKRSFGETFTHAWNEWRDSVTGAARRSTLAPRTLSTPAAFASSRATVVPGGGRYIVDPRWLNDSTLIYSANDGRQTPGLYRVIIGSLPSRIARRNSLDVSDPTSNGSIVFSQGEFIDRFHTRGDLYVNDDGNDSRLTDDARLSEPSVRGNGEIVAVQTVPSSARLVRVSSDGSSITPLTAAALDTQWTAPRWSPDGTRIAAIRIAGAVNELVVLDTLGAVLSVPVREHAVLRAPAWLPDGRSIAFTSDAAGLSQVYVVRVTPDASDYRAVRLTDEGGGVQGLDIAGAGSDSVRVAITTLRADGNHVLVWTVATDALRSVERAATRVANRAVRSGSDDNVDRRWSVHDDTSSARPYSPWRTLMPAYWSPTFAQEGSGRGNDIGALTGASDVTGRHSYLAETSINLHNANVSASLSYNYNRWINPALSVTLDQSWSYSNIVGGGVKVGDLERRSRLASVHATFSRPRVRTYSAFTIGAEFEQRDYATSPGSLLARISDFYSQSHNYPALVAAAVFSNTQRPSLSISPEDGFTVTGSIRQRWESSVGASGRSAVFVGSAYKSLDLPGFAHHVIAVRAAVGAADRRSPSEYEIGGVSGSSIDVVPGVTFGSAARTFPVRGFVTGAETGVIASAASAEYRIPLFAPSRSLGLIPFFVDRVSLAVFADAARAACPASAQPACSPSAFDGPTLASMGAELNLDSALQFDVPYRFRFGIAHPLRGASYAGASALSAYATLGLGF